MLIFKIDSRRVFALNAGWLIASVLACCCTGLVAADLVYAKEGSGVYGYKDTPKLPWCEWLVHDPDRPAPPRVDPGKCGETAPVPSDAVVLFNGEDLSSWKSAPGWEISEGTLVAGKGGFFTKEAFGDMQLHMEWMGPANFTGPWYNRGNNGVLLMGLFEIQIFDSYTEKIYPDGQCAAIYGQIPPLVNATRPPGEWQSFDIIFKAPRFAEGKLRSCARVTVFHNGVLVHLQEEIRGETGHRILPEYNQPREEGPVGLSGHDCPVRFRSIWVRRL